MVRYLMRGLDGGVVEIACDFPFRTYWLDGEAAEVSHPWNALLAFTAEDLARFGIERVESDAPPPAEPPPAALEPVVDISDPAPLAALFNAPAVELAADTAPARKADGSSP